MVDEEVCEVLAKQNSLDAGLVNIIANGVVAEMQDLSKIHMSRGPGGAGAVAPLQIPAKHFDMFCPPAVSMKNKREFVSRLHFI